MERSNKRTKYFPDVSFPGKRGKGILMALLMSFLLLGLSILPSDAAAPPISTDRRPGTESLAMARRMRARTRSCQSTFG